MSVLLAMTPFPASGTLAEPDILLEFPAFLPPWIPAVCGALLILFVLARMRFRHKPRERARPAVPPHEEALGALASLETGIPRAEQEEDPFHVILSRIVRRYLAGRYGLAALEMASEEAVAAIEDRGIGPDQRRILRGILDRCDRVKFGRRFAGPDAAREILGQARRFVTETAGRVPRQGGGA